MIQICPKFKADWRSELENDPNGYFVHPNGNSVLLELHLFFFERQNIIILEEEGNE
jgi:hypothetical protein